MSDGMETVYCEKCHLFMLPHELKGHVCKEVSVDEQEQEENNSKSTGSEFASAHLKSFFERVERLEEEKRTLAEDIKEVYAEAKANGFNTKVMRALVKLRKVDKAEQQEFDALLKLYMDAINEAFERALQ